MAISSRSTILIREAQHEDAQRITHLAREVYSKTFGYSLPEDDLNAYLDEFLTVQVIAEHVVDPMRDMFVATSDTNEILGFATLTQGTTEPCLAGYDHIAELQRLYVDSKYQGQGIARLLSEKIEETAKAKGFQYLWLGVWEDNHKAQKLYHKSGYTAVGDHNFVMGETVQRDLIMVKKL